MPLPSPSSAGPCGDISAEDFDRVARTVHRHLGIHLAPGKRTMLSCRLRSLVQELGCGSFTEFAGRYLDSPSPELLRKLADRVSTNHTFFHREPAHFAFLAERILPEVTGELRRRGTRDLRAWCAAASTGEEPYELAMIIRSHLGHEAPSWQAGLLATDLSGRVLDVARRGVYRTEDVRALPPALADRWFRHRPDGTSEVVPELQGDVTFRRFNLITSRFPFRRPFHFIFCRNVMIYFDDETKRALVGRMHDALQPGGFLVIGHAETITGVHPGLRPVRPGVYRRAG